MEHMTLAQLAGWLLAVFGALAVIDKAGGVLAKWLGMTPGAKKDEEHAKTLKDHEERILALERETNKAGRFMAAEAAKMEQIEENNRVTMQAILALMAHAIDGNNTAALSKAKSELENYLINK